MKDEQMYHVTYKNVLKPDKNIDDYQSWLNHYWPIQQKWGAKSYQIKQQNHKKGTILLCQYTVDNLDQWTKKAIEYKSKTIIRDLEKIVDIDHISIKITDLSNIKEH